MPDGVFSGGYSFIFANPEVLILIDDEEDAPDAGLPKKHFGIVADKAHVIPKWWSIFFIYQLSAGKNK